MTKGKSQNWIQIIRVILCVIILFVCTLQVGEVVAKYIMVQKESALNKSEPYHFSSNYLTSDGAIYDVIKTNEAIEIEVYNYEILNTSLNSAYDITYKISVSNGWNYQIKDGHGESLENSSQYILTKGQQKRHVISLSAQDSQTSLTIEVETISPFKETLSATFNIISNEVVDYSVSDVNDYVILRIETNDYVGDVIISWDSLLFVPDNTNELMLDWQNSNPTKIINVVADSTYELVFFKLAAETYSYSGSGTTINVGGGVS